MWDEPQTKFQSTLPAGEATCCPCVLDPPIFISIHASRGGSDLKENVRMSRIYHFNPRFPRGKRQNRHLPNEFHLVFQSTLPAGEATSSSVGWMMYRSYFNPRFPRGKRPSSQASASFEVLFQSTLPAGEATGSGRCIDSVHQISIHASRGGSDRHFNRDDVFGDPISIHASRGGSDPSTCRKSRQVILFQSTLPAGEATFRLVTGGM